jgi:arylsulfatase A-like enzyme
MLWFCSDNGPARQNSPRHVGSAGHLSGYKLSINEGGVRVPGLLVWPNGTDGPRTIDAPAITTDYFPTILDALDIPLSTDRDYDGTSLLPIIRGQRDARDATIGFLNRDGNESAWVEDRYKLLIKRDGSGLYDILSDPGEKKDLTAQQPIIAARMHAELSAWKADVMADLAAIPE